MEYYSALKNEGHPDPCYSMGEPGGLKKISQPQKDKYIIPLIEVSVVTRFIGRKWKSVCQEMRGDRNGELLGNGYRVSILQDKKNSGHGWW